MELLCGCRLGVILPANFSQSLFGTAALIRCINFPFSLSSLEQGGVVPLHISKQMLNKGWAVTELGCSPSPFSQSRLSLLHLVLWSWAWLWSGFSFWKWQVISQYVFTICMRLSKEATNGLCHGTVSARFLGTSSDAERTPGNVIRDCAREHLTPAFPVQCRSPGWAESPLKVTSVCALHPAGCPGWAGGCRGGWIVVTPSGPVLHLGTDAVTGGRILETLFLLPDWLFTYPKQVIAYFPDRNCCCKASSLADC